MQLDKLVLATDSESFLVSSRQENHDALLSMLKQAKQSLDIYSHNLDGSLYDTHDFTEALKRLSLKNKATKIRVLLKDIDYINKHGHRLVELARRLPTFIEIRHVSSEFEHITSSYAVVDNRGIIFRNDALRFDAKVNFNDPMLARDLAKQFNTIWEQSNPSQEMRSLHI